MSDSWEDQASVPVTDTAPGTGAASAPAAAPAPAPVSAPAPSGTAPAAKPSRFRFAVDAPAFVPGGASAAVPTTPPSGTAPAVAAPTPASPATAAAPAAASASATAPVASSASSTPTRPGPAAATPSNPATPSAPASAPAPAPTQAPTAPSPAGPATPAPEDDLLLDDEGAAGHVGDADLNKEHLNIIFIGHVDAGKSTISGHIMYLTGQLDQRTLEKYEREAKAKGRESWKFAWALDITEAERAKGKTQEVGRATFVTESKRYTIMDAPGHKAYVPHMIGGATQADVGVLVISARKGEFEAGLDRGGQTREHVMLAKTAGVRNLVVVINKMDDPTVQYSQERYNECVDKLTGVIKAVGYNPKDVMFMPVSGLTGENLKTRLDKSVAPWWDGPSLLEYLDSIKAPERTPVGPLRMVVLDKIKEGGSVITIGKLEMGQIRVGQRLLLMPTRMPVEVSGLEVDDVEVDHASPGDNLRVRLKNLEEDDVHPGFVLCDPSGPCNVAREFDATLSILELKSILTAGYQAIMHLHALVVETSIEELYAVVDKKTQAVLQKKPKFVRAGMTIKCRLSVAAPICIETYKDFQPMGRVLLRDEGKTVAVGIVTKLHPLT